MKTVQLNQHNISKIAKYISCPTYNREALKTGIVHIGVGGFHRSHQGWYIDQLLENCNDLQWGICGIGLREGDRKMYDVLKKQDGLYTLIVQNSDGDMEIEVIGALKEYIFAVDNPQAAIDKLAHPDTKIVSLTITEGGYNFNQSTEDFNFENPDIKFELKYPEKPKTVFGFLAAALKKRRANGLKAFSILSCDNIQHNGDVTRKMLLAFTQRQDAGLAFWIEKEVSFPNTMVDRITPVTTPDMAELLKKRYYINDEWPVVCEPFIQWVIEDDFSNGRPLLEKVGEQLVSDVAPYEKMKIRLLNAGHSVLGIPGAIHGHQTINACMEDMVFATFMRRFMDKEATPVLGDIEGIDLEKYKDSLEERFANPNIKDAVSRICSESSAKLPKFLIPTIKENLLKGGSIKYSVLVLAAWCYYSDKEVNEYNESLEIIDEKRAGLHNAAKNTENDKFSFLRQVDIFDDLIENKRFTEEYKVAIEKVYKEKNIRKLMAQLI